MKNLFKLITVLFLGLSAMPLAHAEIEEAIHHYEGESIENTQDAYAVFKKYNAEISQMMSSDALSDSHMERIHEITYTLKNAIDRLIKEKAANENKLGAVDEAVQALHYSSESHEEPKIREWFSALETSLTALHDEEIAAPDHNKTEYAIVIKDHKFAPETITVPAGKKIKLLIDNQDSTPEEFESHDMNREKIIAGNSKATIYVGPLKPGKYHYFGEFNMNSANGYIIVE